jgi:hypothetical protein
MYEILTLGIIAYGILIGCFAILVRERDELQKGYNNLLQENKELRASNAEMLESNYQLLKKNRTNGIK